MHLHVFPRYAGDSFRINADWRIRERDELDATAKQVRAGLSELNHSLTPLPGHLTEPDKPRT